MTFCWRHLLSQERRQRDAVVQRIRFVGEQRRSNSRIELAQPFGARRSGKAVPDDDVSAVVAVHLVMWYGIARRFPDSKVVRARGAWNNVVPMESRLVQLLGSFITTTSAYSLARLEYAMTHPAAPSPPLIERLPDASQTTLVQRAGQRAESQVEAARRYLRAHNDRRGKRAVYDASFASLERSTRELEQYARAMRWLLTVEEGR